MLNANYILWAWDTTLPENRQKLFRWLAETGPVFTNRIKSIERTNYPLLVVLKGHRGRISMAKGNYDIHEVSSMLSDGIDYCQSFNIGGNSRTMIMYAPLGTVWTARRPKSLPMARNAENV